MIKSGENKAQAAIELAVFGSILIFVLGSTVRSALGNSYAQNQNLKAMRMALLASWKGSRGDGAGNPVGSIGRNTASILFLEDRITPDVTKYGSQDRVPDIASGSGTFTYQLLYPINATEVRSNLPLTDIYINGQHFTFTTASFTSQHIAYSNYASCPAPSSSNKQQRCLANQCLRNQREWVKPVLKVSDFWNIMANPPQAGQIAQAIFNALALYNMVKPDGSGVQGTVQPLFFKTGLAQAFKDYYVNILAPQYNDTGSLSQQLWAITTVLKNHGPGYKLFYSVATNGSPQFRLTPPGCSAHPCKDLELSSDLVLGGVGNANGDLMFDLERVNAPSTPVCGNSSCSSPSDWSSCMRCNLAWQWSATAGTPDGVGVDDQNGNYPAYDIDGRLKTVNIYSITPSGNNGDVDVSYEDYQGGDLDMTWDVANSCGPRPGLLNPSQIFSFTKDGTYLEIKEGKLYNPGTGSVVRSVNKMDNVNFIQRVIQLSNNTGRFCTIPASASSPTFRVPVVDGEANPVELCVNSNAGPGNDCYAGDNIKMTCMDVGDNMLFIRSRIQDLHGRVWITNTSGSLGVQ